MPIRSGTVKVDKDSKGKREKENYFLFHCNEIPGLRLAVEVLVADSASSRSSVGETHVSATCR